MSSLLNLQGKQFFENIKNKIKEEFVNKKREGFVGGGGILGPNETLNEKINSETEITTNKVTNLNEKISNYDGTYRVLQKKTDEYLNNQTGITQTMKKNYNVFINRSLNQAEIQPTNIKGCVVKSSIINTSNKFSSNGFDTAYPANFINYNNAEKACKLWAADSNKTYYAVSKDDTNKFKCHVANELPNEIQQYKKETILYKVLSNTDATVNAASLLNNGQIGIFNNSRITDLKDQSKMTDVNDMKKPKLVKIFKRTILSQYTAAELAKSDYKGYISNGWWNDWGEDKYPTEKAWWITTDDIFKTGVMGYFYYVYYSPTQVTNAELYYFGDDGPTVVKINGRAMTTWFTQAITLNAGINIIEVKLHNSAPDNRSILYWLRNTSTQNPGAFMLYLAKPNSSGTGKTVLVKTGDEGWGYTDTQISDISKITNSKVITADIANPLDPYYIKTLNSVPAGYDKCDRFVGGSINKQSIIASFGHNCSNVTFEPIKIRYITIYANPALVNHRHGNYIQIRELVVNAFVNGIKVNVAPMGITTTNSEYGSNNRSIHANDGNISTMFHSGGNSSLNFWSLDLGQDYLVSDIIYQNRPDWTGYRAQGMTMILKSNNNTEYKPIIFPDINKTEYIFPINKNTVSVV